jgi:coronin-1B/1C/6
MSRFVRSSKFRHVFGTPAKKENTYDGVKPTRSAWDSNKVAASTKFIGLIWDAQGGGAFAVLNSDKPGKLGQFPLVAGHSAEVLDIDFNPFNPNIIASASEDGYAKVWQIPDGGLTETLTQAAQSLSGHKRKVGTLNFNPVASNVLATTSTDFTVKIWDIERGDTIFDVAGHSDIIQSSAWNYNGQSYATASKDKKVRVIDPRSNSVVHEVEAHQGVKGMRVTYLGRKDKLFSMGFSKTSERQFSIWDPRAFGTPIKTENVDTGSGILMPFYDDDTNILYLGGKGDGNIRYYEVVDEDPYIFYLTEYKSNTPQRGMALVPKTAVDTSVCEIARILKVTQSAIEPISFTVPRKSDIFQDDLYPPTYAGEPSLTAEQWKSGKNAEPKTVQLGPGFVPPSSSATAVSFKQSTKPAEAPKSGKDLEKQVADQQKRIAQLEAELKQKDERIAQLEGR